eukprot:748003-Hanusia_phi.AAC.3
MLSGTKKLRAPGAWDILLLCESVLGSCKVARRWLKKKLILRRNCAEVIFDSRNHFFPPPRAFCNL